MYDGIVPGGNARGFPGDGNDFSFIFGDPNPVAELEGLLQLEGKPGKEAAQGCLGAEADHGGKDGRSGDQTGKVHIGVGRKAG